MPAAAPLAATLASTAAAAGTMATIAKGVVLASTAIGVVGMATGSKTLQKIGAIGGAVGGVMTGVGMLASPGASLGQAAMGINSTTRGAEGLLGGAPTTPDTPLTVTDVMKSTPISQIGDGIGSVAAPIGDLGAIPQAAPAHAPSLSSALSSAPSLSSSLAPSPSPSPSPAPSPSPSQDTGSLFDRVQNNLKKYDTAITVLGGMASGFQQHQQMDVQRQAHKDNVAVQRERLQLEREREEERRRNASGAPQVRALGSINAPGDPGIRTYQGPAAPAAGLLAVPQ